MIMKVVEGLLDQAAISRREARAQLVANELAGLAPSQVDSWIDANVIDLASARTVIKKMAKAIVALARLAT